jgi:hypothetical protein
VEKKVNCTYQEVKRTHDEFRNSYEYMCFSKVDLKQARLCLESGEGEVRGAGGGGSGGAGGIVGIGGAGGAGGAGGTGGILRAGNVRAGNLPNLAEIVSRGENYLNMISRGREKTKDATPRLGEEKEINEKLSENESPLKDFTSLDPYVSSDMVSANGYLWKRGKNMLQAWHRRYFAVEDGKFYVHKFGDDKDKKERTRAIEVMNLSLCTVKNATESETERRFCFFLISPMRSYLLQAETESAYRLWVTVLQNAILKALNSHMQQPSLPNDGNRISGQNPNINNEVKVQTNVHNTYDLIRSFHPQNHKCADCNARDPQWVSVNLGVIICIECSGIHRSLGTHISKVRSLTLDAIDKETIEIIKQIGNAKANQIFECLLSDREASELKPTDVSGRPAREGYIYEKYVLKKWVCGLEIESLSLDLNEDGNEIGVIQSQKIHKSHPPSEITVPIAIISNLPTVQSQFTSKGSTSSEKENTLHQPPSPSLTRASSPSRPIPLITSPQSPNTSPKSSPRSNHFPEAHFDPRRQRPPSDSKANPNTSKYGTSGVQYSAMPNPRLSVAPPSRRKMAEKEKMFGVNKFLSAVMV